MIDVIIDTLKDSIKLIPFLFLAFLLLEYIEHKVSTKSKNKIIKAGKYGPLLGSILGAFPQCGFSAAMTNMYAARVISVGTLIAVYLSTSDEMLPIMLTSNVSIKVIASIIGLKVLIGMVCGFIVDFMLRNKKTKNHLEHICDDEHCDCEHGLFRSSIKHTLNITFYIMIISFVLNVGLYYLGEENIGKLLLKDSLLAPFISSLVGLIPNCAASVVITELYLNNAISFASAMAGLLTGSGIGILMLFKVNENKKENIKILITIYGIGVISGIIIELIGMVL